MSIRLASDIEKLKLFDQLFTALTVDEIKNAIGADLVVGKLRDCPTSQGPIMEMVDELISLKNETMTLRADLNALRFDTQVIVKLISKPHDVNNYNDMNSLKNRYSIF
jgi:hypothetical protein